VQELDEAEPEVVHAAEKVIVGKRKRRGSRESVVQVDIKVLLSRTENELVSLRDKRPTISHLRMFLTRLSMTFYGFTRAAIDGNYHEVI